jgi:hypothetical protein
MSKLTFEDTDWGQRILAAKKRGSFTAEDRVVIDDINIKPPGKYVDPCALTYDVELLEPSCGCAVSELFEKCFFIHCEPEECFDSRLHLMCMANFPRAIKCNDIEEAEKLYTELLRIRNEEYA